MLPVTYQNLEGRKNKYYYAFVLKVCIKTYSLGIKPNASLLIAVTLH